MTTTAKKKRATKKTTASKGAAKATKKVAKKGAKKVGKKASKKVATKGGADGVEAKKNGHDTRVMHAVQGVSVSTADGRKPKNAANAYLNANQIVVEKGFNPRTTGLGDIETLTASIRAEGLLQNLVVRPAGDGKKFKLIAGERRLTALKQLGGKFAENIPVLIRLDLEGEDDRARAVAVAESSPDGRLNLSPIEVGKVVEDLTAKGWAPARIAKETGLHPKKVQRVLQVMETPDDVKEMVHSGEWSQAAAIEFHRLPSEVQDEIKSKVGRDTTAAEIRKLRRQAEREAAKAETADGAVKTKKTKRGTPSKQTAPSWRPAREKQAMLRELCAELEEFEGEEIGQDDYHEIRGAIAWALYDRGDLESPILASIHTAEEKNPTAAKKANAYFDSIVKNEAALHTPAEEGEEGDED